MADSSAAFCDHAQMVIVRISDDRRNRFIKWGAGRWLLRTSPGPQTVRVRAAVFGKLPRTPRSGAVVSSQPSSSAVFNSRTPLYAATGRNWSHEAPVRSNTGYHPWLFSRAGKWPAKDSRLPPRIKLVAKIQFQDFAKTLFQAAGRRSLLPIRSLTDTLSVTGGFLSFQRDRRLTPELSAVFAPVF